MKKAVVLYNSRGGNTKKVAHSIAKGLDADIFSVRKVPNLEKYNMLVIGTWVIAGKISPGGKRLLNKLKPELKGKKVALFLTAGGPQEPISEDSNETTENIIFARMKKIIESKGLKVLNEHFSTKGAFRFIRFGPGKVFNAGLPDKEALKLAENFGQKLKKHI
ncbi:MAG: flavodoxin family protein [Asgard group archaeon]|nr:flavodoxin family protein [Asgard group archaeon]